jgi:hypothetical protein
MASEPSPPANRRRFSIRGALLVIAAISVILAAVYNYRQARESARLREENARLTREMQSLKLEAELKQFEEGLKAPIEAITWHNVPFKEISKLRQQAMKKSGIDYYPPYSKVCSDIGDFDLPITPTQYYLRSSSEYAGHIGSYESYWESLATRTCERLAMELSQDKPLGRYLRENPTVFRKRLRPLLLRLVQGPIWMRSSACETLIVGGDRTEAVLDAVGGILSEPKLTVHRRTAKGEIVVKEFSRQKQKWTELNERYQLDLPVSENGPPKGE